MEETCSRCQQALECRVDDIQNCDCNTIQLQDVTKTFLKKTSYKCLCNNCLQQLDYFAVLDQQYKHPTTPSEFVPHIHYYIENGFWVFTEFFHYQKGKCCQNGCRHCVYGYKK
ncbi:Cysteine-rich CWC [Algoriella xinjiangensis]|uniref:Cysteine-rich CWC n=1 Tax=Algoriella xinjiangensis TaxID=684065 RepID=A0A1I4SK85_9FLAO|nr:cysteine-rich CWC family protein [Algoriella xinjiangensis]SFM64849.1 Cysteine-rich CWC [Algoriella xinjiangensis]VDH16166.1 Uncharacterised protein [Algoriella xinjiangensis]